MRIVSLVPSATEIVCALGLSNALVGISQDCDFPPEVRGRPVLSAAIVEPAEPSISIDRRIREAVHNGQSVYHLDVAALARLAPDLILTQELCAVCAPSYTLVARAAKWLRGQPQVLSLEPTSLSDVLDNILLVGRMAGRERRAEALVEQLRARIEAVRSHAAPLRPRVACLEWLDPLYAGGRWIPEMVDAAGGLDMLGEAGKPSRLVSWEAVLVARPEVLVLMPCGFDVRRTRTELGRLTGRPGWTELPAVRGSRVYLTDASAYFNRPGPRLVDGLEILASAIHPETFRTSLPADSLEKM
jgi:iron complex transport system substrate-binding protein